MTLLSVCLLLLAGCTSDEKEAKPEQPGVLTLRMTNSEGDSSGTADAGQIKDLTGYLFENGVLTKVFPDLSVGQGGTVTGMMVPVNSEGRLYFVANVGTSLNDVKPSPGSFYENDFKKLVFASDPLPEQGATWIMSGYRDLDELRQNGNPVLYLTRGFARFDVEPAENITIGKIKVETVAQSVYLFGQEPVKSPENTKLASLEKVFSTPIAERQEGVFYLYEQTGKKLQVEVTAEINGVKNKLEATLPTAIKRNHTYKLKVTAVGSNIQLSVLVQSWNEGDVTEATPDLSQKIKVDVPNSILPATMRVSESRDTVYIPYYGERFRLALEADTELEVKLEGIEAADPEVTVTPAAPLTPATDEDAVVTGNMFDIETKLTSPGSEERYVYLEVRNKNLSEYYGDRIVLVIQKNTTVFTGRIHDFFDGKVVCEMKEYADGDLGFVELEPGSNLQFTGNWIKIEPVEESAHTGDAQKPRYKIVGGYKPNDPEADGRKQEGNFIVTHANGKSETYPASRPNNGLPVVMVDGKYWCKFNLQGNARSFEDQIQISDPVAQQADLYAYLKTCPDDEYMRLMGDAYKGQNLEGLKLKHTIGGDDTAFGYENYNTTPEGSAINFSDPTKHCPPGYQVPDYQNDILPIFGFRTTTFVNEGTEQYSTFTLNGIVKTAYRYSRMNIPYDGGTIPRLFLNKIEFTKNDTPNSLVLFGSGWQENNTTINFNLQLFANIATDRATLVVGEYFSITQRSANVTRAIRCIKSPVDFIITD